MNQTGCLLVTQTPALYCMVIASTMWLGECCFQIDFHHALHGIQEIAGLLVVFVLQMYLCEVTSN